MPQTESYFVFLDKPEGITSQRCLSLFKKKFCPNKIGHHGTLDPFATGILLVGVNEAVKFFRFVNDAEKTYEAVMEFGVATDTLDRDGTVTSKCDVSDWTLSEIEAVLRSLTGAILQKPPMYSAVKKDGERLYELARRGVEVEREERVVRVFELVPTFWEKPRMGFRARVSRGTYVRVLAEQIAERLGNVGHLVSLRRTRLCGAPSSQVFDFEEPNAVLLEKRIAIPELLTDLPRLDVSSSQRMDLYCGRSVILASLPQERSEYYTTFHEGTFIGMTRIAGDRLIAERLMSQRVQS